MSEMHYPKEMGPFWKHFGFFIQYMQQGKLYYQITLLALAHFLHILPVIFLGILVSIFLFLASYKLAFEVLSGLARGDLEYHDVLDTLDEKIGFKALAVAVIQIIIVVYMTVSNDQATGMALLVLTALMTPAFLMMLSQTQSLLQSLNPFNLMTVVQRIGSEYVVLAIFYSGVGLLQFYLSAQIQIWIPNVLGQVIAALVLYTLLVFSFAIIGYVMYRHADELDHETIDVEVIKTQPTNARDPLEERIEALIQAGQPAEAIAIINELKAEDGRTDLDHHLAAAENQLVHVNRRSPAEQLAALVEAKQLRKALALVKEYADDGHLIKPPDVEIYNQVVRYAFENNQFKTVILLCRDFEKRYPHEHQSIVDNYHMVAQIYYRNNKRDVAAQLLEKLIKQYHNTSNVDAISSYLKGIHKLNKN